MFSNSLCSLIAQYLSVLFVIPANLVIDSLSALCLDRLRERNMFVVGMSSPISSALRFLRSIYSVFGLIWGMKLGSKISTF